MTGGTKVSLNLSSDLSNMANKLDVLTIGMIVAKKSGLVTFGTIGVEVVVTGGA